MYRVFAAEYFGAEGDLEAAVGEYLEAALKSDDPAIARRATRVALAAQAWQQASMAALRWSLLDPGSVAAREAAARSMLNIGDYAGAEFQILEILDLMDDPTEAWVRISNLLARSGDPERADAVLERILASRGDVDRAEALFARSQLAVRSGDLEQAFEMARRAVELDPERIEFLTWAGRVALNLNLAGTGLEYIRRAWLIEPEDHDLGLAYADLLARTGDPDSAREVMMAMPQTPDVMLSRIMLELAVRQRQAAENLFTQFEEMDFDDTLEKRFYQAQAAEALDMTGRAIELYGEVDSGNFALGASIRRAELMASEGNLELARRELAELRLQSNEIMIEESWLAEARILREAGQRDEAFLALDLALKQLPGSIQLLYSHALLAAELGWVDIAEHDLRAVISAQPENAAALNALGYTLADQTERYEEAEALIRQAYILQPEEASIIDSMGWVAYRLGRLDESEEFLRQAWGLDKNPEIAAHLGEVLWVSGDRDAALSIWREGQAINSGNPVLVETLDRLGVDF
jgi:tetratricopeptide (TPR) repeat protein